MSNKGRYGILAVRKWGEKALFINEAIESEEGAIMEAIRIFRNFGMQKVIVVDEKLKVVFTDERRCRCSNVQLEIDGKYRCGACGIEIDYSEVGTPLEVVG